MIAHFSSLAQDLNYLWKKNDLVFLIKCYKYGYHCDLISVLFWCVEFVCGKKNIKNTKIVLMTSLWRQTIDFERNLIVFEFVLSNATNLVIKERSYICYILVSEVRFVVKKSNNAKNSAGDVTLTHNGKFWKKLISTLNLLYDQL